MPEISTELYGNLCYAASQISEFASSSRKLSIHRLKSTFCVLNSYIYAQTHYLKKAASIFAGLILCLISFAQPARQYSFTHYGTSVGLSANEVNNILQDREGYMWMATTSGLQRFDGIRYKSFRSIKGDSTSLPDDYVMHLYMDRKNNLWVLTGNGKIGTFDTRTFKFRQAKTLNVNDVILRSERKLLEDDQGNLMYLLASNDILTYNEARHEFAIANNFIPRYPGMVIVDIAHQPGTSKYVIGTHDGIFIYNRATNKFSSAADNKEKDPLLQQLGKVPAAFNFLFDNKGRLWFNSWKSGVPWTYCFDLKNGQVVLPAYSLYPQLGAYHECRGIIQQKNGTIWMYGLGVFAEFDEKEKKFRLVLNGYLNEQSISYERVNSLYEDSEHNVWVSTNNNGVYRFNPDAQFFLNVRALSPVTGSPGDGSVMSFVETKKGNIFAGSWSDGVTEYTPEFDSIPMRYPGVKDRKNNPFAWSMYASGDSNTIWMAAQPGLYALDQRKKAGKYYNPEILKSRTLRQVIEDRRGNLWIGTQSIGLYKWKNARGNDRSTDSIIQVRTVPDVQIFKITEDSRGRIWVATNSFGVYVLDAVSNKLLMHFNTRATGMHKIASDVVSSVFRYDDSTMIIAATNIYVYNIARNTVTMIPYPESIGGSISALERDRDGYLWISLSHGLLRLNIQKKIYIHFDRIDGIMNDRFIVSSSMQLKDGRILFGASNQFVVFDPAKIQINQSTPEVVITDFKLLDRSLRVDSLRELGEVELSAKENSLVIEFSGLKYINTYLIKYKLEGLDNDWREADKTSQAIYSYLPPGTYTFMLRSQDAEGNYGKKITKLVIRVRPPFWRTWWFYAALVLAGICILYFIDRQRIRQLKDMQRVRSEIATQLHQDVTTTLSNINLLGEMAKIKADRDIERSKEYIDQISSKSHNMIIAMDDILWSVDPQNDGMEKTLLRMLEFIDALKNRHGCRIELELDNKITSLRLDMKTRLEFFLIFKEALRMIVELARGTNTLINIDLFRKRLSMKLQDATARLDMHIPEIEQAIKEINFRAESINAESDIQYDKNGIAIILLIGIK